jgi:hypothetical protein
MTIVIECSPAALFGLFETRRIRPGMSRQVPGGATIQLGEMPLQKRDLPTIEASLIPLLRGAASRTRRLLAFSYPRDRSYMRTLTALQNFWRRLRGNAFRTFVHPPERMGAVLEAAGLMRIARQGTLVWVLDLYRRRENV